MVLPLLVFSIASYSAPVTSPVSEAINEAIATNPLLGNYALSFEQFPSLSSTEAGITSGLPKSFSELLPSPKKESMPIGNERADTRADTVLLSLLATIIPLFGLMALSIDQRYMYGMAPSSHKAFSRRITGDKALPFL